MLQFKEIKCFNILPRLHNFNQTVAKASIAIDLAPLVVQQLKEEQHIELQFQYKEAQIMKTRPKQTLIENHHKKSKKNRNKFQQYPKKKHL